MIGPLTQACFNPARDFGPRLFADFAGWGKSHSGPRTVGTFTVYISPPMFGAVLGRRPLRILLALSNPLVRPKGREEIASKS